MNVMSDMGVPMHRFSDLNARVKISAVEHFVIAPKQEVLVPGQVSDSGLFDGITGLTEKCQNLVVKRNVATATILATVQNNTIPVSIYNPTSKNVTIWPKTCLGYFQRDNDIRRVHGVQMHCRFLIYCTI